jgi:hypothetical protein
LAIFCGYLNFSLTDAAALATTFVTSQNLTQGDELNMQTTDRASFTLVESGYQGKCDFTPRDFSLVVLT